MRRQGIDKVSQLKKESWILKITLSVLLVAIFSAKCSDACIEKI